MVQALIGIIIGIFVGSTVPMSALNINICAIILITSVDTILGAIKAKFEESFSDKNIISEFIVNLMAAMILLYLGSYLSMNLHYMAFVAFSIRIFKNLSLIRLHLMKKFLGNNKKFVEKKRNL